MKIVHLYSSIFIFFLPFLARDLAAAPKKTSLLAENKFTRDQGSVSSQSALSEGAEENGPALPLPPQSPLKEGPPDTSQRLRRPKGGNGSALPLPASLGEGPGGNSPALPPPSQSPFREGPGGNGPALPPPPKPKGGLSKLEQRVPFSFDRKPLTDIIDVLSEKKDINILPPQQPADLDALKRQVITFHPQGRTSVSINEAWNLLMTFLELSGFGISKKRNDLYVIVRQGRPDEPSINREILPLYVNTPASELPNSEQRIRYIYYLTNFKVPTQEDKDTNPVGRILKDMLTPGSPIIFDPKTNGIIITDKGNVIASVMHILENLDKSGFKETVEVLQLQYVQARDVVKVFDSLKKAAGEAATSPFIRSDSRAETLSYFAGDTRIIADDRLNTLIIMGRESAVERISDFVQQYMDVPPEEGKSILHEYDLQYLDAQPFAEVLNRIVAPPPQTAAQAAQGPATGPERYFQGVVVAAEEVKKVESKATTEEVVLESKGDYTPAGITGQIITGGNRLIIAAMQDDWIRLRDFISVLDKPQPQVILEVLIIDITDTKVKLLAGDIRNATDLQVPDYGFQFLSNNISPVNSAIGVTPTQLATDLLQVIGTVNPANPSVSSMLGSGSTLISFNDPKTPGIAALIQFLDTITISKILSHPFLVTTNNQKATITSQDIRRVQGDAVSGAAGVITIPIIDLPATLQVQMIPRLNSLERLSLQVAVDINTYENVSTFSRTTRRVSTNANLKSGQILVIGGLTRIDQGETVSGTPFFQRIPLIGSFFSNKNVNSTKTNIAIFISPTIVQPKLRGGLDAYTSDRIRSGRRDIDERTILPDNRDPIMHVFFRPEYRADSLLTSYLAEVNNPPDAELIKTTREKRNEKRKPTKRPLPPRREAPKPGKVQDLAA